jgi:hypothetical protein
MRATKANRSPIPASGGYCNPQLDGLIDRQEWSLTARSAGIGLGDRTAAGRGQRPPGHLLCPSSHLPAAAASVNSPISAFRRRGSMNGFTELPRLPVERWLCRSCPWRRPAPGTFGRSPGGRAANRDVHPWFASDSPLEGGGFEPSVPRQKDLCKHRDRWRSRAAGGADRRENGENADLAPLGDQRR